MMNQIVFYVSVVKELDDALTDLVNWDRFAIHLPGINSADTNKIAADFSGVDR